MLIRLGYIYNTYSTIKKEKGWRSEYKAHGKETPAIDGPCIGYGTHTNIRLNGKGRAGSIMSCKCCEDTSVGPVMKTLFKAV